MLVLVVGWFSFEGMGTTAGDLLCKDEVCSWLELSDIPFDVSILPEYSENALDWRHLDPINYTDVIFVCGPLGNGWPVDQMLLRFSHCRLTAINVSLMQNLKDWNPFTLLYSRDDESSSYPDLTFGISTKKVPVTGLILVSKQKEYGPRSAHDKVNLILDEFKSHNEISVVPIDTALPNQYGLRTPAEVESLIAVMDVVITTRLHGTALSLKQGIPVIAIDPILGGAKVSAQARAVKWPVFIPAEDLTVSNLQTGFEYCTTPEAREMAKQCALSSKHQINERKNKFLHEFGNLVKHQTLS